MRLIKRAVNQWVARRVRVPLDACVHYCGFRYARNEFNPYEGYAIRLAQGMETAKVRRWFVEVMRSYRPRTMGEALGISLTRELPLWLFPWARSAGNDRSVGWLESPTAIFDMMTSFSEAGIPQKMLQKEYDWHENAFRAMSRDGYQPRRHSYVTVAELRGSDRSAYIVADGNHRVSALSALGVRHLEVLRPLRQCFRREQVDSWPAVKKSLINRADALAIFDAYFNGAPPPQRAVVPAEIVDCANRETHGLPHPTA